MDKIEEKYEPEIQRLKAEIAEYEKELERLMKERDNSFMNVAFGSVGVKILEGAVQSKKMMEVFRGVMGEQSFNEFQQRLAGIDNQPVQNIQSQKETSRIITEPENNSPRQIALNFIQTVGEKLNDQHLRFLYDIAEMAQQKPEILEQLRPLAENIFKTKVIRINPDNTDK